MVSRVTTSHQTPPTCSEQVAHVSLCLWRIPVLRLFISSDISAAQFLHQDADDADEEDEVNLAEKNTPKNKPSVIMSFSATVKHLSNSRHQGELSHFVFGVTKC